MGLTVNIMSLSGIAISIGVLVDGAIVEVENAYKKLELWQSGDQKGDFHAVRLSALKEVNTQVPMVVRLVGTNEEEGRRLLADANMITAISLADAAQKAVAAAKG
jgi:hypothetical protein